MVKQQAQIINLLKDSCMRKVVLLLASLLTWIGCALGQQRTVTGVVTSVEDGSPLIQLAVQIKGTQTGVVTDAEGRYTIRVAGPESVLVFTYTGYETQEITVGEQTTINVVMQLANEEIDEVMVVAFGKSKKSSFTGAATAVSSKELERKQVSNVVNALAGKVPGVTVTSSNNQPGTSSTIRIRGRGSFSASSDPLYVVDGVPFDGDVSSINPADVESTVLLKDAASAALYGARAANGVVMITTKSGANARNAGSLNVNVTAKIGYNFRGVPDYDKITDPKQYAAKYFESLYNYEVLKGTADPLDAANDAMFSKPATSIVYFPFSRPGSNENVDPADEFFFSRNSDGSFSMASDATIGRMIKAKDGNNYWLQPDKWLEAAYTPNKRQEYGVSLSGRSELANYFFSSGYLNDKGYTVGSDFNRFTSRLRGDYRPKKWLNMGGNIAYTNYKSNLLLNTEHSGDSGNIFAVADGMAPIYPLYVRDANKQVMIDPRNGQKIYDYGKSQYPGLVRPNFSDANPIAANLYDLNEYAAQVLGLRSYIDFLIPYDFKLTFNVGYDLDDTYRTNKDNAYYGQSAAKGGYISKRFTRYTTLNLQQLLNWNHAYGENHIDILLGHEFYKYSGEALSADRSNFYHPGARELDGAIGTPSANSSRSNYRVEGYLGRAQYDWAEKYFVSLSFRRDGSSRFAADKRWGNFYSAGASWLISKESFMESTRNFLDLLKLKISYGEQGNDAIGSNFAYTDNYTLKDKNGNFATVFDSKGNPNITWETSKNFNIGLEFAFFRNRLTGSVDFFRRSVSDMLFRLSVPPSSGYTGLYTNIGEMSNTGVDFEVRGVPYRSKDIEWTVSFNGGFVKNRLEKLPDEWKKKKYGYVSERNIYREGGSIGDLFMPEYKGVGDNGHSNWQTYDTVSRQYGVTEDYTTANEQKNRVLYENLAPKLRGGFATEVDFYGFDFNAGFTYSLGGKQIDYTYADLMHGGADNGAALHKDMLKSWTPEKKTNIPMMDYSRSDENAISSRFLISATYLSIDNLTLGYTFKKEWLDRVGLGSLRVYVVADNVWLFSARKGFDPRFGGGVGYKVVRTISGGLNLTF